MKANQSRSSSFPALNFAAILIGSIYLLADWMPFNLQPYRPLVFVITGTFVVINILILVWLKISNRGRANSQFATALTAFVLLIPPIIQFGYKDFLSWVNNPNTGRTLAITTSIFVAFLIGGVLYYMRFKFRSVYGLSEVFLGLYIAGSKIAENKDLEFSDPNFLIAYLTAAIYLIVRGMDNIQVGLYKEPIDPIAFVFVERCKRALSYLFG